MDPQLFFEISQDFFDKLYPNFSEDYIHDDNIITFFVVCQDFFDQIGQQF